MYMYICNWKEISLKLNTDFTSLEANVLIIPATCIIIERILKKLNLIDEYCTTWTTDVPYLTIS